MATKKTQTEKVEETNTTSAQVEYDLYKQYQEYFEDQQKKVLEFWTATLNNCWWWKK